MSLIALFKNHLYWIEIHDVIYVLIIRINNIYQKV